MTIQQIKRRQLRRVHKRILRRRKKAEKIYEYKFIILMSIFIDIMFFIGLHAPFGV